MTHLQMFLFAAYLLFSLEHTLPPCTSREVASEVGHKSSCHLFGNNENNQVSINSCMLNQSEQTGFNLNNITLFFPIHFT